MDMFEDAAPLAGNRPEFTVSELSGAVKRLIEGEFGLVRVRAEVGRVSSAASGHLYFDLKDQNAVIGAVSWKGQAARLRVRPEEGMEIIATGRMTTFPGQSKYQLVVEEVELAGAGALMAMLERRRKALAAEGIFDRDRKRPIPWLPEVIGVITSPTGAVIRDILHRLRDRFPRRVLIWPVTVQGERCAAEVAAAIRGFNALAPDGPVPRPDVLIVARGGGSIEDLWGFNEEVVVRAAAGSRIPLISAVGHETDTTLIDLAADLRAPTPTAAAEMAVPVRLDLAAALDDLGARITRAAGQGLDGRRQRLTDLARALPRPERLVEGAGQRLDMWSDRLPAALMRHVQRHRLRVSDAAGGLRAATLMAGMAQRRRQLAAVRLAEAAAGALSSAQRRRDETAARLGRALPARALADRRVALAQAAQRLDPALARPMAQRRERLEAADRLRLSLGYAATVARGYAVVRAGGAPVTTRAAALRGAAAGLQIEFRDGILEVRAMADRGTPAAGTPPDEAAREPGAEPSPAAHRTPAPAPPPPRPRKPRDSGGSGQGSLF